MVVNDTNFTSQLWEFKGKVPFVDNWALMTTPIPVLAILLSYLVVVLKVGPDFMKSRSPMNLNKILVAYNTVQVLVSLFLFKTGIQLLLPYGLIDKTCLLNDDNVMKEITTGTYLYFLAKVSELLDTIFFILRKKQTQLTFLHIYHHFSMVLITWVALKYEPTHSVVFLGTLNSFVHIIMYAYYGMAAFPSLSKYLWWKKYITTMQLTQFVMIILHAIANYTCGACPPSYFLLSTIIFNAFFFVYLFSDFYIKSYTKKNQTQRIEANGQKQKAN